ncbi:conserved hypothetical protein [Neospora caninum Liverpool]|uniref:Uncharacterized protein n=1 Tax=Neospora caninum (strain Liverpool) TaxID=572307 RepID=F0VBL7_NEOCL|nr:conserved hypothetical protein [Neospora caninum Liverpool]CBZ51001.1 conserved hypothetical protein [Neospora caninum Liverpool]CEL68306.1 TPA: hypothetical protein BN1204_040760 [Neospora caninum Liverpool]|eukprot:XP_003881034.1 conserved hypothetical protein [Neospora caninum Liverpool]
MASAGAVAAATLQSLHPSGRRSEGCTPPPSQTALGSPYTPFSPEWCLRRGLAPLPSGERSGPPDTIMFKLLPPPRTRVDSPQRTKGSRSGGKRRSLSREPPCNRLLPFMFRDLRSHQDRQELLQRLQLHSRKRTQRPNQSLAPPSEFPSSGERFHVSAAQKRGHVEAADDCSEGSAEVDEAKKRIKTTVEPSRDERHASAASPASLCPPTKLPGDAATHWGRTEPPQQASGAVEGTAASAKDAAEETSLDGRGKGCEAGGAEASQGDRGRERANCRDSGRETSVAFFSSGSSFSGGSNGPAAPGALYSFGFQCFCVNTAGDTLAAACADTIHLYHVATKTLHVSIRLPSPPPACGCGVSQDTDACPTLLPIQSLQFFDEDRLLLAVTACGHCYVYFLHHEPEPALLAYANLHEVYVHALNRLPFLSGETPLERGGALPEQSFGTRNVPRGIGSEMHSADTAERQESLATEKPPDPQVGQPSPHVGKAEEREENTSESATGDFRETRPSTRALTSAVVTAVEPLEVRYPPAILTASHRSTDAWRFACAAAAAAAAHGHSLSPRRRHGRGAGETAAPASGSPLPAAVADSRMEISTVSGHLILLVSYAPDAGSAEAYDAQTRRKRNWFRHYTAPMVIHLELRPTLLLLRSLEIQRCGRARLLASPRQPLASRSPAHLSPDGGHALCSDDAKARTLLAESPLRLLPPPFPCCRTLPTWDSSFTLLEKARLGRAPWNRRAAGAQPSAGVSSRMECRFPFCVFRVSVPAGGFPGHADEGGSVSDSAASERPSADNAAGEEKRGVDATAPVDERETDMEIDRTQDGDRPGIGCSSAEPGNKRGGPRPGRLLALVAVCCPDGYLVLVDWRQRREQIAALRRQAALTSSGSEARIVWGATVVGMSAVSAREISVRDDGQVLLLRCPDRLVVARLVFPWTCPMERQTLLRVHREQQREQRQQFALHWQKQQLMQQRGEARAGLGRGRGRGRGRAGAGCVRSRRRPRREEEELSGSDSGEDDAESEKKRNGTDPDETAESVAGEAGTQETLGKNGLTAEGEDSAKPKANVSEAVPEQASAETNEAAREQNTVSASADRAETVPESPDSQPHSREGTGSVPPTAGDKETGESGLAGSGEAPVSAGACGQKPRPSSDESEAESAHEEGEDDGGTLIIIQFIHMDCVQKESYTALSLASGASLHKGLAAAAVDRNGLAALYFLDLSAVIAVEAKVLVLEAAKLSPFKQIHWIPDVSSTQLAGLAAMEAQGDSALPGRLPPQAGCVRLETDGEPPVSSPGEASGAARPAEGHGPSRGAGGSASSRWWADRQSGERGAAGPGGGLGPVRAPRASGNFSCLVALEKKWGTLLFFYPKRTKVWWLLLPDFERLDRNREEIEAEDEFEKDSSKLPPWLRATADRTDGSGAESLLALQPREREGVRRESGASLASDASAATEETVPGPAVSLAPPPASSSFLPLRVGCDPRVLLPSPSYPFYSPLASVSSGTLERSSARNRGKPERAPGRVVAGADAAEAAASGALSRALHEIGLDGGDPRVNGSAKGDTETDVHLAETALRLAAAAEEAADSVLMSTLRLSCTSEEDRDFLGVHPLARELLACLNQTASVAAAAGAGGAVEESCVDGCEAASPRERGCARNCGRPANAQAGREDGVDCWGMRCEWLRACDSLRASSEAFLEIGGSAERANGPAGSEDTPRGDSASSWARAVRRIDLPSIYRERMRRSREVFCTMANTRDCAWKSYAAASPP